ncbi:endopeptidase La [candidate division NPL-UPA2 bacterium]|nr:endopeptidase La [candidate division NPL-UPA2 bacterium]
MNPPGKNSKNLPLLPLRDIVVFPHMVAPLLVGRKSSVKAVEEAMKKDHLILLSAQKEAKVNDPMEADIHRVGTVAEILQVIKLPDNSIRILVEGIARARLKRFLSSSPFFRVEIEEIRVGAERTPELEALVRSVKTQFESYVKLNPRLSDEIANSLVSVGDPEKLADTVAAHLTLKIEDKQLVLETVWPEERLRKLTAILSLETEILQIEMKIFGEVRKQVEKSQRDYFLHEQLKAIEKELGKKDEYAAEIEGLRKKIAEARMPGEAEEKAKAELDRLFKMMPASPEATVIRNYVDWLISVPWSKKTKDHLKIENAEKILNEDHYGLEKVKERILEFLAVRKLVKRMKGPILCFVGPPGVGKTSLAKSVARALGRNFVRISLGGVRDEAEIRGHRRTYIGALPGRIIQSMKKAKTRNPVFLMDEVDKMSVDFRGDPSAALLEVLDPEQNSTFNDHYLEVDFDLSDVFFITTANTQHAIPVPLQDRMELLSLPGYTEEEKVKIAELFLIPKQLKAHGLKERDLSISSHALQQIIRRYTREAGVRNMEREIAAISRKVAKTVAQTKRRRKKIKVTAQNLHKYLGSPRYRLTKAEEKNEVGVATGLAWTEAGGDIMAAEVSTMKGKGKLTLTGKLGEVMQESAQAALSYIRSRAGNLKITENFYKSLDIHIHIPEGAIPKDGPSAGITMATALVSALTGRPVRKDIAMTGEITLRGKVLPIGGVKDKVLAAHRSGMRTVILPGENKKDLEEIPKNVKRELSFRFVENMDEVIRIALENREKRKAEKAERKKS